MLRDITFHRLLHLDKGIRVVLDPIPFLSPIYVNLTVIHQVKQSLPTTEIRSSLNFYNRVPVLSMHHASVEQQDDPQIG